MSASWAFRMGRKYRCMRYDFVYDHASTNPIATQGCILMAAYVIDSFIKPTTGVLQWLIQ
ncbi:hypothetical protein [Phyllobacterium sp. SB3]|uniref:hypothetical protein n=1 Tax=Phyllobacterium sp. SB3 TaxID=3156073 RepID=UPI0032AF84D1